MIVYKSVKEMRSVNNGNVGSLELTETKGKNYFKLYDLVKSPQKRMIQMDKAYKFVTLVPNKHYKLLPDEVMSQIADRFTEKRKYSESLERTLKDAGMPYEIVKCRTCGGRVKKLEYKTVEVVHGLNQGKRKENNPPEDSKE